MFIERIEVKGLAHYSYMIGCPADGRAVVVDPKRDVDTYLEFAASRNLSITHVLETHIHADYASGARELAERTKAKLCVSRYDAGETYETQFPHTDLSDGELIEIGSVRLQVRHTPGHTPEHISFLVFDAGAGPASTPVAMFSGDFLLVGSLGRPDLLGEDAKLALASRLFDSVRALKDLPGTVAIYPAHGAGSMCGAGMSSEASSTLAAERMHNPYLNPELSRESFVQKILASSPPFPPYYRRMKSINSKGAAPMAARAPLSAIDAASFRRLVKSGHIVIDLRGELPFGEAHIAGAFGIARGAIFSTWAAWVVPPDVPILLIATESQSVGQAGALPPVIEEAVRGLARVGLDDVRGYLAGGFEAWRSAELPTESLPQISSLEASARLAEARDLVLIDVRGAAEFASGHAPGAIHIMGGMISERIAELKAETRAIAITCGGGYRSTVAASVLQRAGLRKVLNLTGGMQAWNAAQLPIVRE